MQKFTYGTAIFLLTLVIAPTYAGINENRVLQLLGQSILGPDVGGAENVSTTINVKVVTTRPGINPEINSGNINLNFNLATDLVNKMNKIEGVITVNASLTGEPPIYISIPLQLMLVTDAQNKDYLYMYMYPEYSQLVKTYIGSSALDAYNNTWIQVSDLNIKSNTRDQASKSKIKNIWNNTSWFTAKVRKTGTTNTYTVKIKPTVFAAKITKELNLKGGMSPAAHRKYTADLVKFFKAMTIQIVENDNKLGTYSITGGFNDTKTSPTYIGGYTQKASMKKVNMTTKMTSNFNVKGTVMIPTPLMIPSQFKVVSLEELARQVFNSSPVVSSARMKGEDAEIQARLSNMRAQAELYYSNNSNYGINSMAVVSPDNGCDTSGLSTTVFGVPTSIPGSLSTLLLNVRTTTGVTNMACAVSPSSVGAAVTNWAVTAKLRSSNDFWCVDSSGSSKKVSYVAGTVDTPEEAINSSASCI